VWLALGSLVALAQWRVDGSSLSLNAGRWVVVGATECPPQGVHGLGVAAVVYSRKQGTMAWGHSSLRVVSCQDGEVRDAEYETYRLSAWNERMFRTEHAGEAYLTDDLLREHRGSLVLFRNVDPVDRGWFGDAQAHNREIYEVWLDLPPETIAQIAVQADRWYERQRQTLRAGEPLPQRYHALSTNCTSVLERLLSGPLHLEETPAMPFGWLRLLEDGPGLQVLHPSHALVRRWGQLPAQIERRPHPLFRPSSALPLDLVVPTTPLAPWISDPSRSGGGIGP
jgi:hypothetical protein